MSRIFAESLVVVDAMPKSCCYFEPGAGDRMCALVGLQISSRSFPRARSIIPCRHRRKRNLVAMQIDGRAMILNRAGHNRAPAA